MSDATNWFKRVSSLPSFVSAFGYVKLSQKPMKPGSKLLVKEKLKAVVVKEEKKVAAKPKAGDDDDEDKP